MDELKLVPVIPRSKKDRVLRVKCQRYRGIRSWSRAVKEGIIDGSYYHPCNVNECFGWNSKDKKRSPCCKYYKGLTFGGVLCDYQREMIKEIENDESKRPEN